MTQPRVAVITPYYREPVAMLAQCHRSVLAQGVAADHLMIADGHALDEIDGWDARHVRLPSAHGDNGNTPRGLGGLMARSEGYDFVTYLDADNWYHDGHLQSLLTLWEQGQSPVCASLRTFHDEAGAEMPVHDEDENALRHFDTSCLLIHRTGFACLSAWLDMPKILSPICDRIFIAALLHRRLAIASSGRRSVAFRSRYRAHYEAAGHPVPADAKGADDFAPALAYLSTAEGVTACVAGLGFWPLSYLQI